MGDLEENQERVENISEIYQRIRRDQDELAVVLRRAKKKKLDPFGEPEAILDLLSDTDQLIVDSSHLLICLLGLRMRVLDTISAGVNNRTQFAHIKEILKNIGKDLTIIKSINYSFTERARVARLVLDRDYRERQKEQEARVESLKNLMLDDERQGRDLEGGIDRIQEKRFEEDVVD